MIDVRPVPYGAPATNELAAVIQAAQAADPLAPITVLVSSNLAGLAARRALSDRHGGLLNVRFLVPARFAELVLAAVQPEAAVAPMGKAVRHEAVRSVLAEHPGLFGSVADHPSTVEAVIELLDQAPSLAQRAADSWIAKVLNLGPAVDQRLRGLRTQREVLLAAADAIRASGAVRAELGPVVWYLPTQWAPGERELFEAAAATGPATAIVGATGHAEVDGAAWPPCSPLAPPRPVTTVVVAPDPRTEVREVVRALAHHLERGVPLYRMAVFTAQPWPYHGLLYEELQRAGFAPTGPNPRTLAHGVVGKVVVGLARLDARLERAPVVAWMASGPLRSADQRPVPAHRWGWVALRAGVSKGAEQWRDRLDRLAHDPRASETERRDAVALAGFIADLSGLLAARRRRPWSEHVDWALGAVATLFPPESQRLDWADSELEAARDTTAAIESLRTLDALGGPVAPEVFADALEAALTAPMPRLGRFGRGVLVGSLADAVGVEVDVAAIVGLVEGCCPSPAADPILVAAADPEGSIARRNERRGAERRAFAAAMGSAPTVLLSTARSDPIRGGQAWPAPWLLEEASRLHGAVVSGALLLDSAPQRFDWLQVVESRAAQLLDTTRALSESELVTGTAMAWRTAGSLSGHRWLEGYGIDRQLAAASARASHEFTEWDGAVEPEAVGRPIGTPISPTSLERWATCGRRYLFESVLRVGFAEERHDDDVLTPLDRGSLVHRVLELLVSEQLTGALTLDLEKVQLRALELLDEHSAKYEAAGRTGRGIPWRLGQRALARELARTVTEDAKQRAELGLQAVAVELRFGGTDEVPVSLQLANGDRLAFKGIIDRVDRAGDGSILVTDYKTAVAVSPEQLRLARLAGTKLQLPVYGLAARALYPEAPSVRARYWFVSERGAWAERDIVVDDEVVAELATVASAVVDQIAHGVFPGRPGDRDRGHWTNCRYCPYDRVCPAHRDVAWERKQHDPALAVYTSLGSPPTAGGPEGSGDQ
ncbi:MAG: hypothetical protein JWL70_1606 [Acidimicrobiia bacterium]|nr:hypothetical protein [Acidimicrobiia bacterium]